MGADLTATLILVIGILIAVLTVAALAFAGFVAYLLLRYLRIKEAESDAVQWRPPEKARAGNDEEEGEREKPVEKAVLSTIHRARNADRMYVDAWREEKVDEGWTDDEIEEFLANRPEIELN